MRNLWDRIGWRSATLLLVAIALMAIFLLRTKVEPAAEPSASLPLVPAARGIIDVDGGLVQIAAQRDGVVREVLVDEGSAISRDQPLAVIDDRAAAIQLTIANTRLGERRAAADAQEARVVTARREWNRLVPLAKIKAVPQKSLDDAESELRVAVSDLALRQAEIATAEAMVSSARYERDVRTVRAPADGTIIRRLVRPGDGVSTVNVTPLFWFAPATTIVVRVELEEQVVSAPLERQVAEISLEESQNLVLAKGRVLRIGRAYGPRRLTVYESHDRADAQVLEAIITFDGKAPKVLLGQRVVVRFTSAVHP